MPWLKVDNYYLKHVYEVPKTKNFDAKKVEGDGSTISRDRGNDGWRYELWFKNEKEAVEGYFNSVKDAKQEYEKRASRLI